MRNLLGTAVFLLLLAPIPAGSQTQPVCPLAALGPAAIEGVEQFVIVGQPQPCPPPGRSWHDFTVTTDFGDGSTQETPLRDQDPMWMIGGRHTYRRAGTYELVATLTDRQNGRTQVVRRAIEVPNAPLRARRSRTVSFRAGQEVRRSLARYVDGNRLAVPRDHRASIRWGDGSRSTASISKRRGEFIVRASHRYRRSGTQRIGILIRDDRGASLRIRARALVR